MTRTARWRVAAVTALVPLALTSCTSPPNAGLTPGVPPAATVSTESPAARSQEALDDLVGDDQTPGCTAAVGERGTVLWQGVSGVADPEARSPLSPASEVDIGSVAKQFTATALLLLEHEGQLRLDDPLSAHLDGLPDWADEVTLAQLMRHTAGVPEYIVLLSERGISLEMESTREEAMESIRKLTTRDVEPGSEFSYSNSHYLLLGLVVEQVTGTPLATYLEEALFRPLDLPIRPVVGSAGLHSYRRSARGDTFELADWHWEVTGAGGLHATPSALVRWADSYRTGAPAGAWLSKRRLDDAVYSAAEESSYGAGIFRQQDGTLWHSGAWAGFHTAFLVSADRQRALAVTCLRVELEPWELALQLQDYWFAP